MFKKEIAAVVLSGVVLLGCTDPELAPTGYDGSQQTAVTVLEILSKSLEVYRTCPV